MYYSNSSNMFKDMNSMKFEMNERKATILFVHKYPKHEIESKLLKKKMIKLINYQIRDLNSGDKLQIVPKSKTIKKW
jgi:hypothetical protein